ncbi:hypothetical protein [Mycoplasmopsis verecunda]|uniref:DUF4231 domain-containing protein n=1 Tax=Mycoplasmopsis verecunda TaxID=171291 RepID=A0A1T4M458_9BACT|nr:hypothetical protein [Mycoplasmopsis verecunda]WPB54729.1 hypothetical protein SAM46_01055 [Mycoplasmopsis verecunda]SJZ61675.1 hypothetical protein SAMN02745154_00620 [Mycoplasmopsis verecunda]
MKTKNRTSSYQAYLSLVNNTKIKIASYGVVYYILNILMILCTMFNGFIAIWYLAGASKHFIADNPYVSWLNGNSNLNYVIATTIINALITFLSGLLSFFVINKKYTFYLYKLKQLDFEKRIFELRLFVYKGLNKKDSEFLLFKRCLAILEIDRFKSSDFSGGYLNGQ